MSGALPWRTWRDLAPFAFINVGAGHEESQPGRLGLFNALEAEFVLLAAYRLGRHFPAQEAAGCGNGRGGGGSGSGNGCKAAGLSVGIISPYRQQVDLLQCRLDTVVGRIRASGTLGGAKAAAEKVEAEEQDLRDMAWLQLEAQTVDGFQVGYLEWGKGQVAMEWGGA